MPEIQLNFPNPLNVSVQIGDVAYFSNPTPVGLEESWTATTTPHMSNAQDGIIKIGEILSIIPWDGFVSSIICNMHQDLYNQYYAQIAAGGCTLVPSGNPPITSGNCSNFDTSYSPVVAVPQPPPNNTPPGYTIQSFFFANPTLSMGLNSLGGPNSYMVHSVISTTPANTSDWCLLDSNHPNYVSGQINYWARMDPFFWIDENGISHGPFLTANAVLDFLITTYPAGGFNYGMNANDIRTTTQNLPQFASFTIYYGATWGLRSSGSSPIPGTYSSEYIENCIQGSFIMFSKDNKANMSDMLGYYASIELRNSSKTEAELFNVGTTFFESSK